MMMGFTMKPNYLLAFLAILTCSISDPISDSRYRCGDWTPYQTESCMTIIDADDGFMNKGGAANFCQTLVDSNKDPIPNLITVQTREKQAFLETLLFVNKSLVDNVWLGLDQGEDDVFRWNDGHEVNYTNWVQQKVKDKSLRCVFMDSGEGANGRGQWVRANCKKHNVVVCEKAQLWPASRMQGALLHLQQQMEEQLAAVNEKIGQLERSHAALTSLQKEMSNLKQDPVPVGFVYVQLPGQQPPSSIWPQTKWTDVSSQYAGNFFRVVGGNAAPFGEVQSGISPRLERVMTMWDAPYVTSIQVPTDGTWSPATITAKYVSAEHSYSLRFLQSSTEVRPQNQAVIVWQRSQ